MKVSVLIVQLIKYKFADVLHLLPYFENIRDEIGLLGCLVYLGADQALSYILEMILCCLNSPNEWVGMDSDWKHFAKLHRLGFFRSEHIRVALEDLEKDTDAQRSEIRKKWVKLYLPARSDDAMEHIRNLLASFEESFFNWLDKK